MPAMSPEQIAEHFIRSMQPKTPEEEAYADFLEQTLRQFYRGNGPLGLMQGYANPQDAAGRQMQSILEPLLELSPAQCQGVQALVQDSVRHALSGLLFSIKQLEVRNRAGVQLELEEGLSCDAHLEWLGLTYPTLIQPVTSLSRQDRAYLKCIVEENRRRYRTAPWVPEGTYFISRQLDSEYIVGFSCLSGPALELADAEVTALHVLRFFQGRNLGKKLLGAAAGAARENGARSLVLWTLADNAYTVGFCRKRGGEEVAEREAEYAPGFRELAFRWADLEALEKQGEI